MTEKKMEMIEEYRGNIPERLKVAIKDEIIKICHEYAQIKINQSIYISLHDSTASNELERKLLDLEKLIDHFIFIHLKELERYEKVDNEKEV